MEITLSMADILYVAGAITAIAVAVNWICKGISYLRKPNMKQDTLIKENQKKLEMHEELLDKDNKRISHLEEQDRLVMQALLALLEHSIDGNNIEQMKNVKKDLSNYLISK